MLFTTLVVETGLYSNFLFELAHRDTTTDPQLQELYCVRPWHFVLVAFAQTTSNTLSLVFFLYSCAANILKWHKEGVLRQQPKK